tara:strand:- start:1344 stop:2969 length:1626 start_codon:yes stop_codon:yes gene_type:complete
MTVDVDQLIKEAATRMNRVLDKNYLKQVRAHMNANNEHFIKFNQGMLNGIDVAADLNEFMVIFPDFYNKFASPEEKRAVDEGLGDTINAGDLLERGLKSGNLKDSDMRAYGGRGGPVIAKTTNPGLGNVRGEKIKNTYNKLRQKVNNLAEQFRRIGKGGKDLGHLNVTPITQGMTTVLVSLQNLRDEILAGLPGNKDTSGVSFEGKGGGAFDRAGIKTMADLDSIISKIAKLIASFEIIQKIPKELLEDPSIKRGAQSLNLVTKQYVNAKNILGKGFTINATKKKNINIYSGGKGTLIELVLESPDYNEYLKQGLEATVSDSFRRVLRGTDANLTALQDYFKTVDAYEIVDSPSIKQKIRADLKALAKGKKVTAHKSTKRKTKKGTSKAKRNINLSAMQQAPLIAKKLAKEATRLKATTSRAKPGKPGAKKRKTGRDQLNLAKIQAAINTRLPAEVRRNMGRPALINQTGRFSNSVKLTGLRQAPASIVADYTYQLNPYETFENNGVRQWPTGYNPKPLISKSIRNLAAAFIDQKFTLRRV